MSSRHSHRHRHRHRLSALVVWLLGLRLLHEANDVWAQASDQVEQSNKNSEPKIEENKNGEKKHCHVKFMSFN